MGRKGATYQAHCGLNERGEPTGPNQTPGACTRLLSVVPFLCDPRIAKPSLPSRSSAPERSRRPPWIPWPRFPHRQAMGNERYEHWGVVVRPGKTVKCDPLEFYCHLSQIALQDGKGNEDVRVFVKVDGKEFLIGTLSVDKYPQYTTSLVFEKEFELLHTSKSTNISALGFKISKCERKFDRDTRSEEDAESDEEVPLAIPLYPNAEDKSKENKSGVEKPTATQLSEPKISLEETKDPYMKADGGIAHDKGDEDYVDEDMVNPRDSSDHDDDSESSNEDEGSLKIIECKNRPAETPLKTPPEKKARIATPSMGKKTGSVTAKRSGYVHVATPYPSSKQAKKTPSIIHSSKQSTSYA
ncbi:hypothetical protein BS78_03G374600 [Paspalum vaginatum]|nr:hypothetical protein BS78_03G374600 [Paspalum vaginatum]KAJ1286731.1 hypothetical protein BS78_03G374600 [Paspalum vaginatum]WJZ57298.1 HD tuin 2 [Paspalum vaginatum]